MIAPISAVCHDMSLHCHKAKRNKNAGHKLNGSIE
jgi:hypothetical protein